MVAAAVFALLPGYLVYRRSPTNPARRSSILQGMLLSSIFIWTLLGASLILCMAFLNEYNAGHEGVVGLVFGGSLLASLAFSGSMFLLARRFAIPGALNGMTRNSSAVPSILDSFDSLAQAMGVAADLREAAVGNAFSFSLHGRGIVALSSDIARSLSSEEVGAVLAHELSHIKNRDSFAKGLARLARLAFPFDPVIRLVEAAIHRERELLADRSSSVFTGKPLALASALLKACATPTPSIQGIGAGLCMGGNRKSLLSLYPDWRRGLTF